MKYLLMFVLLLLITGTGRNSSAQSYFVPTQTPPPANVVTEARRIGVFLGANVPATAPSASVLTIIATGHTEWQLNWERPEGLLSIDVDEQDNRVVSYDDDAVDSADKQAFVSGAGGAVTENEANTTLGNLLPYLRIPAGEVWQTQVRRPSLVFDRTPSPNFLLPDWSVSRERKYLGASAGLIYASISRYSGRISQFSSWRQVSFPPGTPNTIFPAQAEAIAKSAARQYFSSVLRSGEEPRFDSPPQPGYDMDWRSLGANTTLRRLVYCYYLSLPSIPDPNPTIEDRENTDHGRMPMFVFVTIDAVTGEVLFVNTMGTGGGGTIADYTPPPPSARTTLLRELLGTSVKPAGSLDRDPVVLAVLGGKPTTGVAPSKAARQFTRQVGGKPVRFAFNPSRRRLTWQTAPGKWAGIALAVTDARRLQAGMAHKP